jgi:alpha-ribazole phosphatase
VRLMVARHGQTSFNVEGRFTGQLDIPLDERGLRQAEALGQRLRETRLDAVVSSDLQRARATAQAIARHHGLPVEEDADLREIAFGAWEGHTYTEVVARDRALVARWEADPTRDAPPGGETVTELHARVVRALDRWRGRHPQGTVLWAVHGGVIEVLLCHVLKVALSRRWEFRHENASVTELEVNTQDARVLCRNETLHLL